MGTYFYFKSAFLHAERGPDQKPLYMWPPKGTNVPKDSVWQILKCIYGLKDSPLLFHKKLIKHLTSNGYKQSNADLCLLYRRADGEYTILTVIVDDMIIASNKTKHADKLVAKLGKKFNFVLAFFYLK